MYTISVLLIADTCNEYTSNESTNTRINEYTNQRITLYLRFFFALFCPFALLAQPLSRSEAAREAAALRRLLFQIHPAPTLYAPADSLQRKIDRLAQWEGPTVDRLAFEMRLRDILIDVGCGHTYSTAARRPAQPKDLAVLPFRVFAEGDRAWVRTNIDSLQHIPPVGAEIIQIGGRDISFILDRLRRHQPSDGYNRSFGQRLVNKELFFNLLYRKYFPPPGAPERALDALTQKRAASDSVSRVTVVWRDSASVLHTDVVRLTLESKLKKPPVVEKDTSLRILYRTRRSRQFYYRHPQHPEVGMLAIRSFAGNGLKLYRKAFRQMERDSIRHLVIDVRDNLGGSFGACVNLARYVAKDTFSMTASRRAWRSWRHLSARQTAQRFAAFLAWDVLNVAPRRYSQGKKIHTLRYKPLKRHHFDGTVLVLQNGWSFSASSLFAAYAQAKGGAKIIGQESGGGGRTNNGMQIPKLKLPVTKLKVAIPQYHLNYRLGPDLGRGVMPDYPVRYTLADALARRDLEWAEVKRFLGLK